MEDDALDMAEDIVLRYFYQLSLCHPVRSKEEYLTDVAAPFNIVKIRFVVLFVHNHVTVGAFGYWVRVICAVF